MKAYKVSCADDDHGCCVAFAENRTKARCKDTRDCDCDFIDVRIVRAPSFDKLSPGPVTAQQYLDQGWAWCCGYCENMVYDDDNPVIIKDRVYCNRNCVVASRKSHDPKGAHESVVSLCEDLDEWLRSEAAEPLPGGIDA